VSARPFVSLSSAAVVGILAGVACADKLPHYTVTLSAPHRSCHQVPVRIVVPAPKQPTQFGVVTVADVKTGRRVACQDVPLSLEQTEVTWLVDQLAQGETRAYRVAFTSETRPYGEGFVHAEQATDAVEITIDGQLFTRYVFRGAPKPYCYPIIGPTGAPVTRAYPMENVPGEPQDHPHQRSLWFTFGEVNGIDFWSEGPGAGREVHRQFQAVQSGPILGLVRAVSDWIGPGGTKVCEENRELRIYRVPDARLLDFGITIRATEGPVEFGDTKEGMFGIRVATPMQLAGGQGHILNAVGQRDGDTWGKAAEWCDYFGPVKGEVVGIAILDHPQNLRHPTYWHVRDYGLFAANPFGLKYFTGDKTGAGRYTIPQGGELTFRYRVLIHRGTPDEAGVPAAYAQYADPPVVSSRRGGR